jgi:uncharacterized low-complexity protein
MPEPKRVIRPEPLDTASDHMAEMLRRADELLLEWSTFGAGVRAQVDREAQNIGNAVCDAVDMAVRRAAAEGTARAISDQLGTQLAAVSAEVAKLETRARAASRAIAEQRRGDRVLLYALIGAVVIANVLLVVGLLRKPTVIAEPTVSKPLVPEAIVPAPEPVVAPPVDDKPTEKIDDAKAGDAKAGDAKVGDAKVGDAKAGDAKAGDAKAGDVKAGATKPGKPELKAVPPLRPVKQGAPTGGRVAKPLAVPEAHN